MKKIQKIRNGENQFFLAIISSHKASCIQTTRWLVHVLSLAGIGTPNFTGDSNRAEI